MKDDDGQGAGLQRVRIDKMAVGGALLQDPLTGEGRYRRG